MPDLFGKKQLGRATTGGRFYATPTERVEAGAVYFPDESSLLFGVAEYTVEAGNLGAFATEGTFVFEKPGDWLDSLGRKVFYRPSTDEIVNQDRKGDVLIGFQLLANVPDDKLGVVLTQGENSVVIIVTSTADSGAGSLRQAISDANDGDVILFDADVFPVGQTTSILLSTYITINKSVSVYGGFSDGAGGYTSGAAKRYYVYRDIEGVKTKVYIDDDNPATEGETILFELDCRVALDGQGAARCAFSPSGNSTYSGLAFINGSASTGGGLFSAGTSQNILNNCTTTDCTATANGGGITSSDTSQTTLTDCTISGCSAPSGGGFYSALSGRNTLNNCIITSCTATTNGGGVYSAKSSHNSINDCIFDDCSASNGGGVYSTNTSANALNNCVFISCTAKAGGAILAASSSEIALTDCVFKFCNATGNGGSALYVTSSNSQNEASSCRFINCDATNNGAVFSASSGRVALISCVFNSCTAKTGGGCYFTDTSVNSLDGCVFTNCSAEGSGGGSYCGSSSQNTLNSCFFDSCSAITNGGGVYSTNTSQNTLNECSFDSCEAIQGDAIYANVTSVINLNRCVFVNNEFNCSSAPQITSEETAFDDLVLSSTATLVIKGGITTAAGGRLNAATINIDDGAALTLKGGSTTIGAATFTSSGRGYLATAAGIDISSATLSGVVACSYGAGLESFEISADGATWTADDLTTPILIETKSDGEWTTLDAAATGGTYSDSFSIGTIARAFDGVRFLEDSIVEYWRVRGFAVPANGGGGEGDDSPSWTISDATITPNAEEV